MSKFLTSLDTRKIGPQRWLLLDDLVYQSDLLRGIVIAPRGFQTDLASIPRIAQPLFPKVDIYDPASVIHDAGYGNALITVSNQRIFLIKLLCDKMFKEACLSTGLSHWRAELMYWAVSKYGDPIGHPLAQNIAPNAINMKGHELK